MSEENNSFKNNLTCKIYRICGNYPNSTQYDVFVKDALIYTSKEFESREDAEIHFSFFTDALECSLKDGYIDRRIEASTYGIIEFDSSASDIPERYIEGLNAKELLNALETRYNITQKDFIHSEKNSPWGWFKLPNGGSVMVTSIFKHL